MANTLYDYYQSKNQALPSVKERQVVANQAGIKNYSGTAEQNTQLLGFLQGNSSNVPASLPQGPIDASQFGGNTSVNLPQQIPTTNPNTVVAGMQLPQFNAIDVTKSGAYGQATNQLNTQAQGINAAQRRILELQGKFETKGAEEAKFQQQFQLAEKQKAQDAAAQAIQASQKAYLAEQIAVAGRPIGLERQGGKLDQLRRREAIDLLSKSIVLDAATGDVQSAQRSVDNALKLEFEPIQAQIDTTKQFLEFNMDNFNHAEKQQAKALDIKLDREKTALQNAREDKKFNANMALEMLKLGKIDGSSFSSVLNGSSSLSDALKNSGVNAATLGTDPLSTLQGIIKDSGAKTDDKLKLTGSVIAAAQKFASINPTGNIAGFSPVTTRFNRLLSTEGRTNRSYLSALTGTIESWMTGASVSEEQQKRIKDDLVPKITDTDRQVKDKLNALTNYMLDYSSGNLATQGINYRPQQVDLWTLKTDPLNLGITSEDSNPLGI